MSSWVVEFTSEFKDYFIGCSDLWVGVLMGEFVGDFEGVFEGAFMGDFQCLAQ